MVETNNTNLTPSEKHIQAVGLFTLIIKLIYEAIQARRERKNKEKEE